MLSATMAQAAAPTLSMSLAVMLPPWRLQAQASCPLAIAQTTAAAVQPGRLQRRSARSAAHRLHTPSGWGASSHVTFMMTIHIEAIGQSAWDGTVRLGSSGTGRSGMVRYGES
jgi:hypothetical protein